MPAVQVRIHISSDRPSCAHLSRALLTLVLASVLLRLYQVMNLVALQIHIISARALLSCVAFVLSCGAEVCFCVLQLIHMDRQGEKLPKLNRL